MRTERTHRCRVRRAEQRACGLRSVLPGFLFLFPVLVAVTAFPQVGFGGERGAVRRPRVAALRGGAGGLRVEIEYPQGSTNRAEVFVCSNLMGRCWESTATVAARDGTNRAEWIDGRAATAGRTVRFYAVVDAEEDSDSDGLTDGREVLRHGTSATRVDSDGDGMPDGWEVANGFDPLADDGQQDPDRDGAPNEEEYDAGTNPQDEGSKPATDIYVSDAAGDDVGGDGSREKPFKTIGKGLAAAQSGRTVVVQPGTYRGAGNRGLDFGGKALVLRGAQGPGQTVIDCEGLGRAFRFHSGEGADAAVVGLTICGGFAANGGAISCEGASPSIVDCVLTGNRAGNGGAVCSTAGARPSLVRCVLKDNRAQFGGGVNCGWQSEVVLEWCRLEGNDGGYEGGAIDSWGGRVALRRCMVRANRAAWGGSIVFGQGTMDLRNCTVLANRSADGPGGVVANYMARVMLTNSIVWGNDREELYRGYLATAELRHCAVQGLRDGETIAEGVRLTVDGRLLGASAGIDAAGATEPEPDLDNEIAWDHPGWPNVESICDIGADEFVDADHDRLADEWELEQWGNLERSGAGDEDGDGLDNLAEYENGSSPLAGDSDGDGASDGWEYYVGTDSCDSNSVPRRDPNSFQRRPVEEWRADLDVDSNNDDGFDEPQCDDTEDASEGNMPGKVEVVDDGDEDEDGVPDFADGFNLDGVSGTDDDEAEGLRFVPVVFEIDQSMVTNREGGQICILLNYDASPPEGVAKDTEGVYRPASGGLRLWTKDGTERRSGKSTLDGGSYLAPGAYNTWDFGFRGNNRVVFYAEAVGAGGRASISFCAYGTGESRRDEVNLTPLEVALLTDYNRDRRIDDGDRKERQKLNLFHFWVNDDNDVGAVATDGGTDKPDTGPRDAENDTVDGERDMVDFFPVFLDIKGALDALGTSDIKVRLSQGDSALNFFATDLQPTNAGAYLIDQSFVEAYGNTNAAAVPAATGTNVVQIEDSGVVLSNDFLRKIQQQGMGVILLEAREESTAALVLQVLDKNGKVICSSNLRLRLSGVEDMYRHVNLRTQLGGKADGVLDRRDEPSGYSDSLTTNRYFVHVHGFLCDGDTARAGHAEVFKRLFWSGSRAKFCAVSWYSDEKENPAVPAALCYYRNVQNAFRTAPFLADVVNQLDEPVTIAAHSLGNMVVSSAIQDHGMTVDKYLMINAAVATEAYDASSRDERTMVHPDWRKYTSRVWASEWYKLFPQADGRRKLTWKSRFSSVPAKASNFFSPGDEVLEVKIGKPWAGAGAMAGDKQRYAWWAQELLKGRVTGACGGSFFGGWQFPNPPDYHNGKNLFEPWEMAQVPDARLRVTPFFDNGTNDTDGVSARLYDPVAGSDYATRERDRLLARMIPAVSKPAGTQAIRTIKESGGHNVNLQSLQNGWPRGRKAMKDTRWLHGDHRDVACVYAYKVYDTFVAEGRLK